MANSVYDFTAKNIKNEDIPLSNYQGKVLLIVNTASKCGYTPQYTGLEELHQKYSGQGLEILGFPCNQFGGQEPGTETEIQEFCSLNFGVTFPLFAKVDVNGANAHPLYSYLKEEAPGILGTEGIKWNFTKFLVDRHGQVVKRYAPGDTPAQIEKDLADYLSAP